MIGGQCPSLTDRMPEVVAGRSSWTPDEEQHLAACSECAAEWLLVRRAANLGAECAAATDPQATAVAVVTRLLAGPSASSNRGRGWWAAGLVAAAAVVVLLLLPTNVTRNPPTEPPSVVLVPELDSLGAMEHEQVLDGLDSEVATSLLTVPHLTDLERQELEWVLQAWEG